MIQCKRVYEQASPDDGYRVLVDRLWPRGVKKTDLAHDEWCKTLAPSNALRQEYHSEAIDFATFSKAYQEELAQHKDEGGVLRRWHKSRLSPSSMARKTRNRITPWF